MKKIRYHKFTAIWKHSGSKFEKLYLYKTYDAIDTSLIKNIILQNVKRISIGCLTHSVITKKYYDALYRGTVPKQYHYNNLNDVIDRIMHKVKQVVHVGIREHWDKADTHARVVILNKCYIDHGRFFNSNGVKLMDQSDFKDLPIIVKATLRSYWSMK